MPRIVQHYAERRPKLVTLIREGDPHSAVGLVVQQLENAEESTFLAALLSVRLADATPGLEVLPRLGGVTIIAPIDAAVAVPQLIRRLDHAIRTPASVEELARSDVQYHTQRFRQSTAFRHSAAERALCLHEEPVAARTEVNVERARQRAFSEEHARFGVVGTSDVAAAVDSAIRTLEPWPQIEAKVWAGAEQDQSLLVKGGNRLPHLDIAWWTPTVAKALSAKREIQSRGSAFREVLSALPTPMQLNAVRVSPQPRGSCVALSISQAAQTVPASIEELVAAGRVASELLRRIARPRAVEHAATLAILEQTDPGLAAELAALVGLSSDAGGAADRLRFEIDLGSDAPAYSSALKHKMAAAILAPIPSPETLPLVRVSEHGQGNLFALIASPCAAWSETSRTVGASGLLMRMLASRYHEIDHVKIDPWITPHGAGLIGHTPRLSVHETPEQQAARLGDVLGRVMGTLKVESSDLWEARSELLASLGPGPRPALWRALSSLSPRHPGLVLPDGYFSSIESLSLAFLREKRAELLRLPLRLAVIENENAQQAVVLREALMRWGSVLRLESRSCPELVLEDTPRVEDHLIESRHPDPNDAASTMAMPLPSTEALDEVHAALLQRMLAGTTGWLARHMRAASVAASVDARIVGGLQRRGLVVVLGSPLSIVDEAATSVRGLFQDLGAGIVPNSPSLASAIAWEHAMERSRRRLPQMRLEDLWLSRSANRIITEATFREFLKRAFSRPTIFEVRSVFRAPPQSAPGARGKR